MLTCAARICCAIAHPARETPDAPRPLQHSGRDDRRLPGRHPAARRGLRPPGQDRSSGPFGLLGPILVGDHRALPNPQAGRGRLDTFPARSRRREAPRRPARSEQPLFEEPPGADLHRRLQGTDDRGGGRGGQVPRQPVHPRRGARSCAGKGAPPRGGGGTAEAERLDRNLGVLATTGSVTPFIGLFGTVWGIMNAFQAIGISGSASLAAVAPGISEALVTTAAGLFAAIPAVIGYNLLLARARRLGSRIERFVLEFASIAESQIETHRAASTAVEAGKIRL